MLTNFPKPATYTNGWLFIVQISISLTIPFSNNFKFLKMFFSYPNIAPMSLAVPIGIWAKTSLSLRLRLPVIDSLKVPSPPIDITKSTISKFVTISLACPLYSVFIKLTS